MSSVSLSLSPLSYLKSKIFSATTLECFECTTTSKYKLLIIYNFTQKMKLLSGNLKYNMYPFCALYPYLVQNILTLNKNFHQIIATSNLRFSI